MDKEARKQLEKVLYILVLSDMEKVLFYSKQEIKKEIEALNDTSLLNAIYSYS